MRFIHITQGLGVIVNSEGWAYTLRQEGSEWAAYSTDKFGNRDRFVASFDSLDLARTAFNV